MISRLFEPTTGIAIAVMAISILATSPTQAEGPGPGYSYAGISYERTDVKYGLNPNVDDRYNSGSLEGENIDISLGLLEWLHVQGQAFGYLSGTCNNCNPDSSGNFFDADVQGYKFGVGFNPAISERADFVVRLNYVDTEVSNLNNASPSRISDNGWSIETLINGQISEQAAVFVGYEYTELSDVSKGNITVGIDYRVFRGLAILGRGIIFDSQTGFEVGLRWYFGGPFIGDSYR